MCEFKVIVEGKIVFEDSVYAKSDMKGVIVKNILGESMKFEKHLISEVNVKTASLILTHL